MAGALAGRRRVGRHLVVSSVEHSAVLHAAEAHQASGAPEASVTELAVDRYGRVDPASLEGVLGAAEEPTALVCLQSANHEVGTVQPVGEIASLCAEADVPLLVDASQSLGWQSPAAGWSLLAASARKWGGPAGVGFLAVRKGVRFAPTPPVDERESGRMPGFPNLPAIVAAAASLRAVRAEADAEAARLHALVDRIRSQVPRLVPDCEVVGDPVRRLPHLVTFSCLYADGESLTHALDRAGFSVSSGSSCTSSTLTPSHVLRAMGVLSEGNVRVSLPPGTMEEQVTEFLAVLPEAVRAVRAQLGAPASGAPVSGHSDTPVDERPVGERTEGASETEPGRTVDALGRRCPIPVIELAKVIEDVPVGGVVTVLADDEAARLDIPAWCSMRGHHYLGGEGTSYRVRRVS